MEGAKFIQKENMVHCWCNPTHVYSDISPVEFNGTYFQVSV